MADNVLDLCVRNKNNYHHESDNEVEVEITVKEELIEDEMEPHLLRQQLHRPMTHMDPSHSAIMMHLQERIYADENLHSPPYMSASPSSNGSTPDTSHTSPIFSPLSRTMANSTTLSESHRSPTYFTDLPPSNGRSIAFPYPVHLSVPRPTVPRILTNGTKGKATRPFKAYTKETLFASHHDKDFEEFRAKVLSQTKDANLNKNGNKNMKRPVQSTSPHQVPSSSGDVKDQSYWEKRRKNNEAAKRSRDARRAKEDELAIRVAYLQNENIALKAHIEALNQQLEKLSQKNHQSIYA